MEKNLQYFKDKVALENGYQDFEEFDNKSTFCYDTRTEKIITDIAERYADYRVSKLIRIQSEERNKLHDKLTTEFRIIQEAKNSYESRLSKAKEDAFKEGIEHQNKWIDLKDTKCPLVTGFYFVLIRHPIEKNSQIVTELIVKGYSTYPFATHVCRIEPPKRLED